MAQLKIKQVLNLQTELDAKAVDTAVMKKASNLSDVSNVTTSRSNLSVYSIAEVDALIAGTGNAKSVATIAARNALTNLNISDRVFVTNDGDGNWAIYIVTAIGSPNNGTNATWEKIADQDSMNNALSAAAVKTAYESNGNTNAFTDAEQNKVGFITVTQAVNLDNMESDISTNASGISTNATAASTAQTTANAASTAASNAQSTANSALSIANAAEPEFTEAVQTFTGLTEPPSVPLPLTLSNAIAAGFVVTITINGLEIANTPSFGTTTVEITPPFPIETSDVIFGHL